MAYLADSQISSYCGSGGGLAVPCAATGLAIRRHPNQGFLSTTRGGGGMGNYVSGSPFGSKCGCGGGAYPKTSCGMSCGMNGLSMDGSGLFGTGIFGTGVTLTDVSSWGAGEIGVLALGLFAVASMFSSTKRAAVGTAKAYRQVRRRIAA